MRAEMANPPLILFPLPTRLRLVDELLAADWQPDPEEQRQAVRWPLRLLSVTSTRRSRGDLRRRWKSFSHNRRPYLSSQIVARSWLT